MVGGAHGQDGHHVLQHAVMVRETDNVFVTILPPYGEELIVLVTTHTEKLVTLRTVQVCTYVASLLGLFDITVLKISFL